MLTSFHHDGAKVRQGIPSSEWKSILDSGKGLLWVDMEDPTEEEVDFLADIFDFHSLSIEDCIFPLDRPKIDDYDNYLFITFHAMNATGTLTRTEDLKILELNIYIGANYVVTFHDEPIPVLNQLRSKCSMQSSLLTRGADFLLHLVMDNVVDEMTRILGRLEDRLDVIEDNVIADREGALEEINEFKNVVSKFRKVSGPHRDVVGLLMNKSFSFISDHQVIYFKDVHDHLVNNHDTTNLLREMIVNSLDSYMSVLSKKTNVVIKVLTIATVIFMPLNLIASLYGMNFSTMPGLDSAFGFYYVLAAMLISAFFLIWLLRRIRWI